MPISPELNNFQSRVFDLFLNARWHRDGAKVTAERTRLIPVGNAPVSIRLAISSSNARLSPPSNSRTMAQVSTPFVLLHGTCERSPIALMFIKLPTLEVLMRWLGAPNSEKARILAHCSSRV